MDFGDKIKEGRRQGMGVSLGECRIVCHRALSDKGVREEVAGNNRVICSRETNIQTLYRRIADGGFH